MLPQRASLSDEPRGWKLRYIYCEGRWTSERAVVSRKQLDDIFSNLLISAWIPLRLMSIILWASLAWKSESD